MCLSRDPATGQTDCYQARSGFPFAVTTNERRNTGDDVTCAGNTKWFGFCVTQEATEHSPLKIEEIRKFRLREQDELFAVASARAGCNGKTAGGFTEIFNPYDNQCGNTYAELLLPQAAQQAQGSIERKTITVDGRDRSYIIFRSFLNLNPQFNPAPGKAPLVLDLHGYTGCAEFNVYYTGWLQVAASQNMVLVWPQSGGYAGFNLLAGQAENYITSWNTADTDFLIGRDQTDDVKFLDELIAEVESSETYQVDKNRVYMAGHSDGSNMAQKYALEKSDKIAGVASHANFLRAYDLIDADNLDEYDFVKEAPSGSDAEFVLAGKGVAVHTVHATTDEIVSYPEIVEGDCLNAPPESRCFPGAGAVKSNKRWADLNECQSEAVEATTVIPTPFGDQSVTTSTFDNCKNNVKVQLATIPGAGHYPYFGIPQVAQGGFPLLIPTTQNAWDFISQFTK